MRAIHYLQGLHSSIAIHCLDYIVNFCPTLIPFPLSVCCRPAGKYQTGRKLWIASSKRGFSYYLIPFQPLTEIRGLRLCSAGVSYLSPSLPSYPGLPFSPGEIDWGGRTFPKRELSTSWLGTAAPFSMTNDAATQAHIHKNLHHHHHHQQL